MTSLLAWHGRYLRAEPDGRVVADRVVEEHWEWIPQGPGQVALRSIHGRYLCAEPDGRVVADRPVLDAWERWTLEASSLGCGHFALRSAHGRYLSVQPDGHVVADREQRGPWELLLGTVVVEPIEPIEPPADRVCEPVHGYVRTEGRRWADDSGPRVFRLCSWFPALRCFRDHPQAAREQLADIATHWQGVRIFWHLGTPWWRGYEVDPRWDGFDQLFAEFLAECDRLSLKVSLSTGDMQVLCPDGDEAYWHEHIAALAASVSPTVVGWYGVWNEGWQNAVRGRDVEYAKYIKTRVKALYPWGAHALTDTDEEPANLSLWGQPPANHVMVHGRRDWPYCMNRAFNPAYEGRRQWLIHQDEPAGLGPDVYAPLANPQQLFGLYTLALLAGQTLTYFGGHGLKSWSPDARLDRDWGFRELPRLWREMAIPEQYIQSWTPYHGGRAEAAIYPDAFEDPHGWGPHRCDNIQSESRAYAVVSAGSGMWSLRSRWTGYVRVWTEGGVVHEQSVREGEVFWARPAQDALVVELHRG